MKMPFLLRSAKRNYHWGEWVRRRILPELPYSWHRSFRHMLPLKPYLSVVDYPSCHTVLPLVVRDAEAVDYENRSANSPELVTLQVIMAHFS